MMGNASRTDTTMFPVVNHVNSIVPVGPSNISTIDDSLFLQISLPCSWSTSPSLMNQKPCIISKLQSNWQAKLRVRQFPLAMVGNVRVFNLQWRVWLPAACRVRLPCSPYFYKQRIATWLKPFYLFSQLCAILYARALCLDVVTTSALAGLVLLSLDIVPDHTLESEHHRLHLWHLTKQSYIRSLQP